jgi:hypothetical protein
MPAHAAAERAKMKEGVMRKVSRETGHVERVGPTENRGADLDGGYSVDFLSFDIEMDGTEIVRGLANDMCQCPHWGYVFSGTLTFRDADGQETFGPGEAFYVGPGHIPVFGAGLEYVQFSPTEQQHIVSEHIVNRLQQLQAGRA